MMGEKSYVIANFEKISVEQWRKDFGDNDTHSYDSILEDTVKIPTRATKHSAGHDIVAPFAIDLAPGESMKIPTGLKCKIFSCWFLGIFPKSGLGFKYSLRLGNSVGIIDSDYYNNENNEGHIWVKIQNDGDKDFHLDAGKAFCQGIFLPYGITRNDDAEGVRQGGLGSTNA